MMSPLWQCTSVRTVGRAVLLSLLLASAAAVEVQVQVDDALGSAQEIIEGAPLQSTWQDNSDDEHQMAEISNNLATADIIEEEAPTSPRFAQVSVSGGSKQTKQGCECTPTGCSCPGQDPPIPSEEEIAEQRLGQMKSAHADIKDEIVMTAHQIKDEKKWVHDVFKIVEEYNQKIKRVAGNVKYLQKKISKLLTKKKQIENMILQTKLTSKLKEATKDLRVLNTALENVGSKKTKFEQSKNDVKSTITQIRQQIEKLQSGGGGQ